MISLTWEQVRAWRLEQQCLVPRLDRQDFVGAAERVLGVQAQVTSAAELAIGVRVDRLKREHLQMALWQDRTLVKTWAMRGTLHVLDAGDFPLVVAARCAKGSRPWLSHFLQLGFTEAQYDELLAAVPEVLGDEPMAREALASRVADRMKAPEVRTALLGSSWGTLWKPSMFRGELCFGPGEGRAGTFVNPRKWLSEWKEWEPEEAQKEVTRRYLQTYGPATPRDFSFWWDGGGRTFGKKMFELLGDEVETVDVEGWKATALKSTLDSMQNANAGHTVRLLPMFDVYVLTQSRNIEPLLAMEHKHRVFRPAAWVSAVVLVDGVVRGVWEQETKKGQTLVKVGMFDTPSQEIRGEVEAEAARLEGFLDTKVAVEFAQAV
ncbi:MAG TPA: winged helix DNA-binding domain-containing protein [Chloroflexia bacterium]|nr:winged helix DNA-binding domain-containing protein [Chloroflexia bacterium]